MRAVLDAVAASELRASERESTPRTVDSASAYPPTAAPWKARSRAMRGRRRLAVGARQPAEGTGSMPGPRAYSQDRPRAASSSDMSIFRFLLRWSWLLILMTVLGGFGGYAYLQFGPMPYKSSATLMLRPQADSSGLPLVTANPQRSTVSALAIAGQAAAPSVYEASSRALAGQLDISSEELAMLVQNGRIQIAPVGSSSFITVSASDPDPRRAWLLADGYARGLMQDLAAQARLVTEQQQVHLRAQLEVLRQQMVSVPLQLNSPGASDTYSAVHARILNQMMDLEARLQASAQTGPPVVRHGETTAPALSITPSRVLIAGAAAGGVGGLALAYLCELLRQYLRRRSRVRPVRTVRADAAATSASAASPQTPAAPHAPQLPPIPTHAANDHQSADSRHHKGGQPTWAGSA